MRYALGSMHTSLAVKNHRVLLWPGLNHFRLATSLRQALHLGDIVRGHAWGGRKKRFQSFVIRLRVLAHGSRTRNGEPARRLLKQPAYYFTSFFTGSFPKTDLFFLISGPQWFTYMARKMFPSWKRCDSENPKITLWSQNCDWRVCVFVNILASEKVKIFKTSSLLKEKRSANHYIFLNCLRVLRIFFNLWQVFPPCCCSVSTFPIFSSQLQEIAKG